MASSLVAKFPGGEVTARSNKGGGLGGNSTPVLGLEICDLGTCWGRNLLKEVRTLFGVHEECKPGFSFLCQQLYKFKLFAKDKETFRLTVREMELFGVTFLAT